MTPIITINAISTGALAAHAYVHSVVFAEEYNHKSLVTTQKDCSN
jgi:hypothetical protein